MATKTARKPTAAKSAKSKSKTASKASSTKSAKSKVAVGKKMSTKSASKTRTTSKAKKAIAPKKPVASKAASSAKKMQKPANDAKFASQEQEESHNLTAQPKMKLSRRKPDNFRDQQRIQSTPDTVNPATRR